MNNQIPETDQWKLNGNCDKCRRKEYCHTRCGANKRGTRALLNRIGDAIIDRTMPEPFASEAKKWRIY